MYIGEVTSFPYDLLLMILICCVPGTWSPEQVDLESNRAICGIVYYLLAVPVKSDKKQPLMVMGLQVVSMFVSMAVVKHTGVYIYPYMVTYMCV